MRLNITKQYVIRVIYMLLSVTLMGFALSLLIRAHMGTDCYSCMNLGISAKLGLPYGPTQLIVNIILFIGMIFVDRSMIGPGMVGNMVIVSFSADFFKWAGFQLFPAQDSLFVSILLMLVGTVLTAIGVSLYFSSDLGVAPYDSLAFIVSGRTKIPFKWCRVAIDVTALVIGWLLGSTVGVGTVVVAFTLGPLITFFNKHLSEKVYRNCKKENSEPVA